MRRLFYFFILPTMFIWNTNSIATSLCYKAKRTVGFSPMAYNGTGLYLGLK